MLAINDYIKNKDVLKSTTACSLSCQEKKCTLNKLMQQKENNTDQEKSIRESRKTRISKADSQRSMRLKTFSQIHHEKKRKLKMSRM